MHSAEEAYKHPTEHLQRCRCPSRTYSQEIQGWRGRWLGGKESNGMGVKEPVRRKKREVQSTKGLKTLKDQ